MTEVRTERMDQKVEVYIDNEIVAETDNAIKLFEDGYEPVIYIPINDLKNIDLVKYADYNCPHKGHAELLTIKHGSDEIENGAWTYNEPFRNLEELKGRVAFYPERVQTIRVLGHLH